MKNFMRILIFAVMTTSFVGCDSFQRAVGVGVSKAKEVAAKKITASIVSVGQCLSADKILVDVQDLLKIESDDGLIAKAVGSEAPEGAQEQGVVSGICKAAAALALPALLQKGVPPRWECQLTDLNAKIGLLAEKACGKIPL